MYNALLKTGLTIGSITDIEKVQKQIDVNRVEVMRKVSMDGKLPLDEKSL